jgi:hypothetical protein
MRLLLCHFRLAYATLSQARVGLHRRVSLGGDLFLCIFVPDGSKGLPGISVSNGGQRGPTSGYVIDDAKSEV